MVRFLDERHPGRYKVYNLCIERGYDSGMFGGRVMRLPLYDGQVGSACGAGCRRNRPETVAGKQSSETGCSEAKSVRWQVGIRARATAACRCCYADAAGETGTPPGRIVAHTSCTAYMLHVTHASPHAPPQAPPLHLVTSFLRDAVTWLAERPDHVVAVHCKAGKGRTGALVCALLLALVRRGGPALGWQGGQGSRTGARAHGRVQGVCLGPRCCWR